MIAVCILGYLFIGLIITNTAMHSYKDRSFYLILLFWPYLILGFLFESLFPQLNKKLNDKFEK